MTAAVPNASQPSTGLIDRTVVHILASQMMGRENWSRQRLLEYQQQSLAETLEYAAAKSPYYREAWGDAVRGGARLEDLPILTKSILMERFDQIVTSSHLRLADMERHLSSSQAGEMLPGGYRTVASGGTTGERSVIVFDQSAWELMVANILRWLKVLGVTPATRVAAIGSPAQIHITNRLFPEIQAGRSGAPRLSVTTPLAEITAALNTYRPELVITYPSVIRMLAEEQLAGRLKIAPLLMAGSAETLTQDIHDLVKEAWGIRLRDMYGTTETGLIGTDCEFQKTIHLAEDLLLYEVVDQDHRAVAPGVVGHKVLLTTLFNHILPLVRYELSDITAIAPEPCPCGRPWARLAVLQGRREDILTLPGKDAGQVKLHALCLREPLLRMPLVRQFQVTVSPDGIRVRVVLRSSELAQTILESVRNAVQNQLDIAGAAVKVLAVEAVSNIDRAGTGAKERLVVNSRGQP